jgi:hypothetical protein
VSFLPSGKRYSAPALDCTLRCGPPGEPSIAKPRDRHDEARGLRREPDPDL